MIIILILFIFGCVQNSLTIPRKCTKKDLCRPVPANICDDSICQPFNFQDWVDLGEAGLQTDTWTFGQKAFIRTCPIIYNFQTTEGPAYETLQTAIVQLNSGPLCNITATTTMSWIPDRPDPNTGKIKILEEPLLGDTYHACFLYLEPGVGYVYRTCRVNPPPPHGQACAMVYAYSLASGNYNKANYVNFIERLGIDFRKETVDCL